MHNGDCFFPVAFQKQEVFRVLVLTTKLEDTRLRINPIKGNGWGSSQIYNTSNKDTLSAQLLWGWGGGGGGEEEVEGEGEAFSMILSIGPERRLSISFVLILNRF